MWRGTFGHLLKTWSGHLAFGCMNTKVQRPKWFELRTEFWVMVAIVIAALLRLLIPSLQPQNDRFILWDGIGLTSNVIVLVVLTLMARSAAKSGTKWL